MQSPPCSVVRSPSSADAAEVLTEQVTALLGAGDVTVGRLCASCGSDVHGRPWMRLDGRDVPVSITRAGEHLLTAVAPEAVAVGIDIEAIDRDWPLAEMLAPTESAGTGAEMARLWAAKEAILKVYGTGLARPMTEVTVRWFPGVLEYLDAPDGYAVAVALLG